MQGHSVESEVPCDAYSTHATPLLAGHQEPSAASPAIPTPLIPWLLRWLRVFEAYVKGLREIQDNAAVFDIATLGNRS
jgi:hypothetical protein